MDVKQILSFFFFKVSGKIKSTFKAFLLTCLEEINWVAKQPEDDKIGRLDTK